MSLLKIRTAMTVFALATLQACGGGGGGGGGGGDAPAAAPVASFSISQALATYVKEAKSSQLSFTGSVSGVSITGSGTLSEATGTTTFEGVTAFQKNATITGTLMGNGRTLPLFATSAIYFDAGFKPLGQTAEDEYCVTTSSTAVPATAKIGDSGNWFVLTCYTDSSKNVRSGTVNVTYVLEPETATTGLLKINSQDTPASGVTTNATVLLRLTTAGELTRISETYLEAGETLTVTYR